MAERNDTIRTIWSVEAGNYRAMDLAQRFQAYFTADGSLKWSQNIRAIRESVPAELLAQWTVEAPAQIARLQAEQAKRDERAAKLAGSIKAGFPGTCALTGKAIKRGDAIKRYGSGWALALELGTTAPVRRDRHEDTESLDGAAEWIDAERRNHERDEIATMRREMVAESSF